MVPDKTIYHAARSAYLASPPTQREGSRRRSCGRFRAAAANNATQQGVTT